METLVFAATMLPSVQPIFSYIVTILFFIIVIYTIVKGTRDKNNLQSFLELLPEPVIIFDKKLNYRLINDKALALLKKQRAEVIGKNLTTVYKKATLNPVYHKMVAAIHNQQYFKETYYSTILDKNLEANFYPSPSGLSLFLKDVDEETKAQEELKRSESNLMRLIDANIVGVAIEDTNGRITYANSVFLSMVGYTKKDLEENKLNWIEMTPKKYRKLDKQQEKILFHDGSIRPYEKEYVRKDGKTIPVLKGAAVLNNKKKTSIIFAVDITDRKEIEKRKDDFISIASHELKTPITSIKGFTQLLIHRFEQSKDNKPKEYLERMLTQINRLTYLVNDILDVRKIQEGKLILNKETFDVNELVKEVISEVKIVSPLYSLNVQTDGRAVLFADYYRIYQAVLNLITNAVKYSNESDPITVNVRKQGNSVEIAVIDNGMGIPPVNQKQIFDKFYRIKGKRSSYPGLGLGLFITNEIVNRHKGKIWVESPTRTVKDNNGSVREFGSTFHILLPLATK